MTVRHKNHKNHILSSAGDISSSENAGILTGGGDMPPPPPYDTGMAFFRYPFRKLVKFFENFVSGGWQRLLIFLRIWCCESRGT